MIEQHVQKDGVQFKKLKKINAKRRGDFWLLFIKQFLLIKQRRKFDMGCLIFLIPLVFLISFFAIVMNGGGDDTLSLVFPGFVISFFICFMIYMIRSKMTRRDFVHVPAFHHLARFIIHIKGDVHRSAFHLKLNATKIEEDVNLVDPLTLGITKKAGTRYKPFQLERYALKFRFKDGSIGLASLHQISIRETSTRRRSSGKTKTKVKHKHKFFYQLVLTLPKDRYHVFRVGQLDDYDTTYGITIREESETYLVKIKYKKREPYIAQEITKDVKDDPSYFTTMMRYLFNQNIISPILDNTISQQ